MSADDSNIIELQLPRIDLYYRPRVELDTPDFGFALGRYRFLFYSSGIQSIGAITYHHLLCVLDSEDRDILYVTAETNELEPDIYLSRFNPRRHATLTKSPLLSYAAFFIPVACMIVREVLALPYETYPMTQEEDDSLEAIPAVMAKSFPEGNIDADTHELLTQLKAAVIRSL